MAKNPKNTEFFNVEALYESSIPPLFLPLQKWSLGELVRPSQDFLEFTGSSVLESTSFDLHFTVLYTLQWWTYFHLDILVNFVLIPKTLYFFLYIKTSFKAMRKHLKEVKIMWFTCKKSDAMPNIQWDLMENLCHQANLFNMNDISSAWVGPWNPGWSRSPL